MSSRIPYGEKVTVKKLSQIEEAEALLRKLGFHDIRVRHHELSQGALARIEIGSVELDQLVQPAIRETLTQSIKSLGYLYVTLDLMGYQRGSLNSARQASNPQPLS